MADDYIHNEAEAVDSDRATRGRSADELKNDDVVESLDGLEIDADDIEAAREQALERLEDMEHDDDHEAYSAGWIDGVVMMDRVLTDPEYFGLREDSDDE